MRKNVDALLIINNERLCDVYSDSAISVKESFRRADDILGNATKSISELITVDGDVSLDFRDVENTMRDGGGSIMAMGRASGDKRVENAILNALDSPLLYGSDIDSAKKILFNIYTSPDTPLVVSELNEIDAFMDTLNPDIEVIWGVSDDNSLGADAKVTILATGLDDDFSVPESYGHDDDDAKYGDIIKKLYCTKRGKKENDNGATAATGDFTVAVGDGQGNTEVVENTPLHDGGDGSHGENDLGGPSVATTADAVDGSASTAADGGAANGGDDGEVAASGKDERNKQEARKPRAHSFIERVKRAYKELNDEIIGDMGAE